MIAIWMSAVALAVACRQVETYGARGEPHASTDLQPDPGSACRATCQKALDCLGAGPEELDPCVEQCEAGGGANVHVLDTMSCAEIAAWVRAQQATPDRRSGGGDGTCTADCRTCVGDGEQCWAAAGGSHGIPCEPCCCAAGSKNPVWR
jgi:hypothetical protein